MQINELHVLALGVWNSLEIAKLLVSGLTPLVVLTVGYWIQRSFKSLEASQWRAQKTIEWKIRLYEELAPLLNDIYCYFMYLGEWKAWSPPEVLAKKRRLDHRFNIVKPLFSPRLEALYNEFMDLCFLTWRGKGLDAGLRTGFESRKAVTGNEWDVAWEGLFVDPESKTARHVIETTYQELMVLLARELDLTSRKDAGEIGEMIRAGIYPDESHGESRSGHGAVEDSKE